MTEAVLANDLLNCPADGIIIGSSGISLDCQGHTVSGAFGGSGILSFGRQQVMIKNCVVEKFSDGIRLESTTQSHLLNNFAHNNNFGISMVINSTFNAIESNIANSNGYGFYLFDSHHNILKFNTANSNDFDGFTLLGSSDNTVISNTANSNSNSTGCGFPALCGGFHLVAGSNFNTVTSNSAHDNLRHGFIVEKASDHNTMLSNTAQNNPNAGFLLTASFFNTLSLNQAHSNGFGFALELSSSNILTSNNAGNNGNGFFLTRSSNVNTLSSNIIDNNSFRGIKLEKFSLEEPDFPSGNLIYNNRFSNPINAINAQDEGANVWNINPIAGPNIVGGPLLGGNFWHDYLGADTDCDGLGDTLLPYTSGGNIVNGGDFQPLVPPCPNVAVTNVVPSPTAARTNKFVGDLVSIAITVSNVGPIPVTGVIATGMANGAAVCAASPFDLAVGGTAVVSCLWDTADDAPGVYTISASVPVQAGEVSTADNSFTDGAVTLAVAEPHFVMSKLSWTHHLSLANNMNTQTWIAKVRNDAAGSLYVQVVIRGSAGDGIQSFTAKSQPILMIAGQLSLGTMIQQSFTSSAIGLKFCFTGDVTYSNSAVIDPNTGLLIGAATSVVHKSGCFAVVT